MTTARSDGRGPHAEGIEPVDAKELAATDELAPEHKQRLLKRRERLQGEIHKIMPDIDRILGFLVDVSAAVGQMGKNVKPIVDRCREIRQLVLPAQSRLLNIPSTTSFPLLEEGTPGGDDQHSDDD